VRSEERKASPTSIHQISHSFMVCPSVFYSGQQRVAWINDKCLKENSQVFQVTAVNYEELDLMLWHLKESLLTSGGAKKARYGQIDLTTIVLWT